MARDMEKYAAYQAAYHRRKRAEKRAENAAEVGPQVVLHSAEYFRIRRAQARENKPDYDKDDPLLRACFVEAGRELREMMMMPALDWPTSKYAKEYGK